MYSACLECLAAALHGMVICHTCGQIQLAVSFWEIKYVQRRPTAPTQDCHRKAQFAQLQLPKTCMALACAKAWMGLLGMQKGLSLFQLSSRTNAWVAGPHLSVACRQQMRFHRAGTPCQRAMLSWQRAQMPYHKAGMSPLVKQAQAASSLPSCCPIWPTPRMLV